MPEHDRFIRGLVAWLGSSRLPFTMTAMPASPARPNIPSARCSASRLTRWSAFRSCALRLATYTGAILVLVMGLIGLYAIFGWILHGTAPGWTSLTLLIVFVSAVQFMVLGLIGEYVGRIYIQSKQRPLFLIAEISKSTGKPN